MSDEEAIEMLEALLDPDTYDPKLSKRAEEAVKVAIEALRERIHNPCSECQEFSCAGCGYKIGVIK